MSYQPLCGLNLKRRKGVVGVPWCVFAILPIPLLEVSVIVPQVGDQDAGGEIQ